MLLLWILLASTGLAALPAPPSPETRAVRVGLYQNPPKVATSASGRPEGIFVDLLDEIARRENWTLEYVAGTFAVCQQRLARGEIDLMPDEAYTAERELLFDFNHIPVLASWSQAYARKGSGIESFLDLNGKRIATLEGSVQHESFAQLAHGFQLKVHLVPAPDYQAAFQMVARGQADAALTNRFYGLAHAREAGLEETGVVFDPNSLYYATTKGDPKRLLGPIDRHLAEFRSHPDSVYYRSLSRWTSEGVELKLPTWLRAAGLILSLALLASLVGGIVLRRQVRARTRELEAANREMEQRVLERTAELAEAKARAEAADRVKSAFLATMSHELRTPMNSILGFSGILEEGLAGPMNPEQTRQIGMVRCSARHLLDLINDVLDISKIEAGELRVTPSTFSMPELLERALATIRPLADRKGLTLRVELAGDLGEVTSDPRRVEQILINLLGNAVKFTEKGGVTLLAGVEGGSQVRLAVRDTGIGIAPQDLQELFQPFRQVDSRISRQHEGTGLGLAICRRLAHLLGGEVLAESEAGKGSTFTLVLPLKGGPDAT